MCDLALCAHGTKGKGILRMYPSGRVPTKMVVAFLATRVKIPNKDDLGKLKQVLKCLNRTSHLKLKLSEDYLGLLKRYVDGSHNVNWD